MKKILLSLSVLVAIACCTLGVAADGNSNNQKKAVSVPTKESADAEIGYGVSIGTVDAKLYSESGFNLDYFWNVTYIAQTSDNTFMGFAVNNDNVYDDETNEYRNVEHLGLNAIYSTDAYVTVPDSIKVGEKVYPVDAIYGEWQLINGMDKDVRVLTLPATVEYMVSDWGFGEKLEAVYMLGAAPVVSYNLHFPKVYVCNKADFSSYLNNKYFKDRLLLPYGWDIDWITVNVAKPGMFAETYLSQNDYDWRAVQYLKVTGNVSDIDLKAIKNLTALMKLDLSETDITSVPDDFLNECRSILEVKFPSTLTRIGQRAFRDCYALQACELNGVSSIGQSAFSGCSSLTNIYLHGVETIESYAFEYCSKLNGIDLSTAQYIGTAAFQYCVSLDDIDLTSAVYLGFIPTEYWGDGCVFRGCSELKNVKFGDTLKAIYRGCFNYTPLESVILPEGLTTLQSDAFSECRNLEYVELPSTLSEIGSSAFAGCTSLSEVVMKNGLSSINSNAFYGCSSLKEIEIPSTVTRIGGAAFENTGITSFKCYAVVPPSVDYSFIGEYMDMSHTYLYVPSFSKDSYRTSPYWSDFFLMSSLNEPIDYILVECPFSINLEEEDNEEVVNNPTIELAWQPANNGYDKAIGQLTATGDGTLSAGELTIKAVAASRSNPYDTQIPTLVNYAEKLSAEKISLHLSFNDNNYYYSGNPWHFISLPYDVKVSDIIPSEETYWAIRRYDSALRAAGELSSTWVNLTKDDTLEAGKGYIVCVAGGTPYVDEWGNNRTQLPLLTFPSSNSANKNNLFECSDVVVPLTEYVAEFAHNSSWNFVGNPYPCYFDVQFLNEEFTVPITVWNGYAYVAYSPMDDDLVLAPFESFFVQCPQNVTEMTFQKDGRMHSADGKPLYKSPAKTQSEALIEGRNVFNFDISGADYSDRARIVLNPDAKLEYEIGRDASKFFADNDCSQIYVAADANYSISERPVADGMAMLGIRASKEESCSLSLSGKYNSEWHVFLTDNLTGETVDLTQRDYEFTTVAGNSDSRFSVKFQASEGLGIDSIVAEFGYDDEVTLTSVNGTAVYSGSIRNMTVPSAGVYIVSDGKKSRKVVLK